ncbi:MAG: ABC transporter permease [Clostridia bacterium]|nr:ABC transporter permease [Clostridia bacterium]
MEELWTKIKRNISRAYKSIRFNWRQYASFFAAIFLMQSFFWLVMLTRDAQAAQLRKNAEENYDYHIAVSGLSAGEAIRLQNNSFTVFTSDKVYEVLRTEETHDAYGGVTHTAYLELAGDEPEDRLQSFVRKYINPILAESANPARIRVEYAPSITLGEDIAALGPAYYSILAIFALVSILVLMLLYNIRINHFKFMYGIYMAFGADYKKLISTAIWELITVSLLTLAPALVFAALIRLILSLMLGGSFSVSLGGIVVVFVLNLAVISAAVALPMRWIASRRPVTLLAAEDNTNLVSSPRRSFNLFGQKFPDRYVAASVWRYRTYYLRLLLSSVIFAAISISVLYGGTMYEENVTAPYVPYTITSPDARGRIEPGLAEALNVIDGVERVECTYDLSSLPAREDHLLLPSSRVQANASRYYVVNRTRGLSADITTDKSFRATNNAAYYPINELTVASLEQLIASSDGAVTVEGDLRAALTTPGMVVVSDSIYNVQRFDLRPGDTVKLALFRKMTQKVDTLSDEKVILQQQLLRYVFDYRELTVGAVIHGMPAQRNIMLGLNEADCEAILDKTPGITSLSVVTDPNLTPDEQAALDASITELMGVYNDYIVTPNSVYEEADLTRRMGIEPLLGTVAVMILLFFPLVCFFSQLLFYFKRSKEFALLLALGAVNSEIRRAHRTEGIMLSGLSVLLTLGLSFLLNWLVFSVMNTWFPSYGILSGAVRYSFGISPLMLLVCLGVALVCGFLSCEIPYHQFIARQKKLTAAADALDDAQ